VNERVQSSQSAPSIDKFNTVRSGSTGDPRSSVQDHSRRESPPGYMSDSKAACNRASSHHYPPAPPVREKISHDKPTSPTLAERIEEKLRQRQERRDSGVSSDTETRSRAATVTIRPGESILKASIPASAPISPSRELVTPVTPGRPMTERAPASRPRAATVSSAPPPTLSRSMSKAGERPRSIWSTALSLDRTNRRALRGLSSFRIYLQRSLLRLKFKFKSKLQADRLARRGLQTPPVYASPHAPVQSPRLVKQTGTPSRDSPT
jgi:hypothetical protein